MDHPEILDPLFREAVSAIDAGDVSALERLLATHAKLVHDRIDYGEDTSGNRTCFGSWRRIRSGKLPKNIAQVTRAILQAAERQRVDSLRDYALGLVCSGRVAREYGVQRELIDVLVDVGADPDGSLVPALAHGEVAAAERLLERGARLTLTAAVCTGRTDDVTRLGRAASHAGRRRPLRPGPNPRHVDRSRGRPQCLQLPGFHPHGTALHHAVDSGSLEAVKVLVGAGAKLGTRDRIHQGTPLDWAEYLQRTEIAAYLREKGGQR